MAGIGQADDAGRGGPGGGPGKATSRRHYRGGGGQFRGDGGLLEGGGQPVPDGSPFQLQTRGQPRVLSQRGAVSPGAGPNQSVFLGTSPGSPGQGRRQGPGADSRLCRTPETADSTGPELRHYLSAVQGVIGLTDPSRAPA